jgi:hypothetical protein
MTDDDKREIEKRQDAIRQMLRVARGKVEVRAGYSRLELKPSASDKWSIAIDKIEWSNCARNRDLNAIACLDYALLFWL